MLLSPRVNSYSSCSHQSSLLILQGHPSVQKAYLGPWAHTYKTQHIFPETVIFLCSSKKIGTACWQAGWERTDICRNPRFNSWGIFISSCEWRPALHSAGTSSFASAPWVRGARGQDVLMESSLPRCDRVNGQRKAPAKLSQRMIECRVLLFPTRWRGNTGRLIYLLRLKLAFGCTPSGAIKFPFKINFLGPGFHYLFINNLLCFISFFSLLCNISSKPVYVQYSQNFIGCLGT